MEYRKKCLTCGRIFCYTDADLKRNRSANITNALSAIGEISGALSGNWGAVIANKSNEELVTDYTKCPSCGSRLLVDADSQEKVYLNEAINEKAKKKDHSQNKIKICKSNTVTHFLPIEIEVINTNEQKEISIEIAKISNEYEIGDMITDVVITSKFENEIILENVCFLNFAEKTVTKLKSDPFPVVIPEYIFRCMNGCVLKVKKFFCNNELITVSNNEFKEVVSIIEEKPSDSHMRDIMNVLNTKASVSDMLDYLKTQIGQIPSDKCSKIYDTLQSETNIESALTKLRMTFKDEIFGESPVEPILKGDNQIICPCCGKIQQQNRRTCFSCGLKFDVDI